MAPPLKDSSHSRLRGELLLRLLNLLMFCCSKIWKLTARQNC